MADRTRLSGTQAGGRVGTFRRTRMARLPPSRHPLHCGLRIPNLRAREDSPLSKSCHQGVPAICLTPRLPVQRIRHCGLNATFQTRLQQCDGDWWSLSPRCYRVAHVARLGTGVEICDTVRIESCNKTPEFVSDRKRPVIALVPNVLGSWSWEAHPARQHQAPEN